MTWVASTNTSDDAIEQIARACRYLTEAHTRLPATKVLAGVLQARQQIHEFSAAAVPGEPIPAAG